MNMDTKPKAQTVRGTLRILIRTGDSPQRRVRLSPREYDLLAQLV